jgi:hypothetical protein
MAFRPPAIRRILALWPLSGRDTAREDGRIWQSVLLLQSQDGMAFRPPAIRRFVALWPVGTNGSEWEDGRIGNPSYGRFAATAGGSPGYSELRSSQSWRVRWRN